MIGVLFTLTGCAEHVHRFISGNPSSPVSGMFRHGGGEPPELIVDVADVRYQSKEFQISKRQSLTELRSTLGSGKHYDQIVSGQDKDHIEYFAAPELISDEGAIMRCSLAWGARNAPAGFCQIPGEVVLRLQAD